MTVLTPEQLKAKIASDLASGVRGGITAAELRSVLVDMVDSIDGGLDISSVYTAQQNFGAVALADAATIAWNVEIAQVATVTLAGNRTLGAPSNLVSGGTYILMVKQDSAGSRTLSYHAVYKWPDGVAPTLSTDPGSIDILSFVSDGVNMFGVAQTGFA